MPLWLVLERLLLPDFIWLSSRLVYHERTMHFVSSIMLIELCLERLELPACRHSLILHSNAILQWLSLCRRKLQQRQGVEHFFGAVHLPFWHVLERQHLHQLPSRPDIHKQWLCLPDWLLPCRWHLLQSSANLLPTRAEFTVERSQLRLQSWLSGYRNQLRLQRSDSRFHL